MSLLINKSKYVAVVLHFSIPTLHMMRYHLWKLANLLNRQHCSSNYWNGLRCSATKSLFWIVMSDGNIKSLLIFFFFLILFYLCTMWWLWKTNFNVNIKILLQRTCGYESSIMCTVCYIKFNYFSIWVN